MMRAGQSCPNLSWIHVRSSTAAERRQSNPVICDCLTVHGLTRARSPSTVTDPQIKREENRGISEESHCVRIGWSSRDAPAGGTPGERKRPESFRGKRASVLRTNIQRERDRRREILNIHCLFLITQELSHFPSCFLAASSKLNAVLSGARFY